MLFLPLPFGYYPLAMQDRSIMPRDEAFELFDEWNQVLVARPENHQQALGDRYVHGGYVLEWSHAGEVRTSQPYNNWDPYEGAGLPEVFEWGLGEQHALPGEPYLRIGVGKMRRPTDPDGPGSLVEYAAWAVSEHTQKQIKMECRDRLRCGKVDFSYALGRSISLQSGRVVSTTSLKVNGSWNNPVNWFAHPFFKQQQLSESSVVFSGDETPRVLADSISCGGSRYSFPAGGSWACGHVMSNSRKVAVSNSCARFCMRVSAPVHHYVLFATDSVFSPEPQVCHAWPSGAEISWSVAYEVAEHAHLS